MASETGGVRPMSLEGRVGRERERMLGMTPEERAWRKRYLQHQILVDEPVRPANWNKERYNPIRRFYRAPMDMVQSALTPVTGHLAAKVIRKFVAASAIGITAVYAAYYYFKYNPSDWTRKGGWRVIMTRPTMYPGDKDFPNFKSRTEGKEFNVQKFDKCPL